MMQTLGRHSRRRNTKHATSSKDDSQPATAARVRHLIISTDDPGEAEIVRSSLSRCITSLDLTESWHVLTLVTGERFGVWLCSGPGRAES